MKFTDEIIYQIAEVCHQTNKAYCETIGDASQLEWGFAPSWQRQSAINGVKFHLDNLLQGIVPSPSASHDSWLSVKKAEGWKYGEVKDVVKKEHPCFTEYENLPFEQRMKDYLFGAVVEAFFTASLNNL